MILGCILEAFSMNVGQWYIVDTALCIMRRLSLVSWN